MVCRSPTTLIRMIGGAQSRWSCAVGVRPRPGPLGSDLVLGVQAGAEVLLPDVRMPLLLLSLVETASVRVGGAR